MSNTIANTFTSFADGSGADALVDLRCGATVRVCVKPETGATVWAVTVDHRRGIRGIGGREGVGYGKTRGVALSEIKRAVADFDDRVAALGPEWRAANDAMYADLRTPTASI
jgi:hypothetical protein